MFHGETGLAKYVGQCPFGQGMVLWHDGAEGFPGRYSFERDVASLLAQFDESGAFQGAYKALSGDTRQLRHLPGDFDDGPEGLLLGGAFIGPAPGFDVKFNRFTEIGSRGLDVFTLRSHVEFRAARHIAVTLFRD